MQEQLLMQVSRRRFQGTIPVRAGAGYALRTELPPSRKRSIRRAAAAWSWPS